MTLSVAIMAHRSRARHIPQLAADLGGDIPVVWDRHNDRWDTGRRALSAYDPAATHHLVIQDDAIVCRDLLAGVERATSWSNDHPVALYMGAIRPRHDWIATVVRQAVEAGACWVAMQGPWWGVGIMLPTAHIPDVVAFGDQAHAIANYDKKIARFYDQAGIDCWYTMPSLVDHRTGPDNPSLIPGRTGMNRRAHRFIGVDRSALDIDWSGAVARPDASGVPEGMVGFRSRTTRKVVLLLEHDRRIPDYRSKPHVWEPV